MANLSIGWLVKQFLTSGFAQIFDFFFQAGEKLGDGVEYAADGISKVYHGIKDKKDDIDDMPW